MLNLHSGCADCVLPKVCMQLLLYVRNKMESLNIDQPLLFALITHKLEILNAD